MVKAFKTFLSKTNYAQNTVAAYLCAVKQFKKKYREFNPATLKKYKAWLMENFKPKTVNLKITAINCYLDSVRQKELRLSAVKVQQKTFLENVISEADYEYFKKKLKNPKERYWYFVIRFLTATGARISELLQIKVEHVQKGYLDLYTKGGKLRRIYIPTTLQKEAIKWFAERQLVSGFIFLNRYGKPITARGISAQLKKLAVKYKLNPDVVYPHSFRHRFAKSFLERFNDIAFLADLMGHESIETTRIYLRRTSTEQQKIVNDVVNW